MADIKIYVMAHKPYRMPEDSLYVPLQVGAASHAHFLTETDDTGENISAKNARFCELTGLYWAWKNSPAPIVGLVHYRRYFGKNSIARDPWKMLLGAHDIEKLLATADVILPKPRHYYIETTYSHYAHAHHEKDMLAARDCIKELCPEYHPDFDAVMRKTHGHRLNMLIMKRPLMNTYCEWLFSILFPLEGIIDTSGYDLYNSRVFGFIGERLLDVWIRHNHVSSAEARVINTETVHWFQKGFRFLKRKLIIRYRN